MSERFKKELEKAFELGLDKEQKAQIVSLRLKSAHFDMLEKIQQAIGKNSSKPPSRAQVIELLIEDAFKRLQEFKKKTR